MSPDVALDPFTLADVPVALMLLPATESITRAEPCVADDRRRRTYWPTKTKAVTPAPLKTHVYHAMVWSLVDRLMLRNAGRFVDRDERPGVVHIGDLGGAVGSHACKHAVKGAGEGVRRGVVGGVGRGSVTGLLVVWAGLRAVADPSGRVP